MKPKTVENLKDSVQRVSYSMAQTKSFIKNQLMNRITYGSSYKSALIFIEGDAGIGKTSLITQVLEEIKDDVCSLKPEEVAYPEILAHFKKHGGQAVLRNYSANDAQDISGMPLEPKADEHGNYIQKYSNPLPQYGYGIYFQDEANRVTDNQVKSTMLSLWCDGGVNGNYLGKGFIQVLAGNNFDDMNYKVSKQDDKALSERYVVVHLKPTFEEVISYFDKKYKTHFMINFLKENRSFINIFNSDKTGFSPRTLDFFMCEVQRLLPKYKEDSNCREIVDMAISVYFKNQSEMVRKYLNDETEINLARILKDESLIKKIKPHDNVLMNQLNIQTLEFLKEAKSLTKKEVETLYALLFKFNAETKDQFMDQLYKVDNLDHITSILRKHKTDFFSVFVDVKKSFATAERAKA